MKRIFTWSGRVCVAIDRADAIRILQLEAFTRPAVYDLTDDLLALAKAHPAPAMGGGADMDERLAYLKAEDARLRAESTRRLSEATGLAAEVRRLTSENDMLKAGYDVSVAERRRLDDELRQASAQQDVIAREIIDTLKANDSLKAEVERLNAELVSLQGECDHLGETRAFMAQELPPCAHEAELEALRKENAQLKELVALHESDDDFEAAAEAMAADIAALEARQRETDAARRERVNLKPCSIGSKYPPEVDQAIRRKFEQRTGWDDLVAELDHAYNKRQLIDRSRALGLRARDVPAQTKAPVPAVIVPVVVNPPDSLARPGLSLLASRHGGEVMALTDEFLNPDEIAKALNDGLPANDRLNAAQVRKIQVEMRAYQRGAA